MSAREIGRATLYMAWAGLRYGALLGALFGITTAIFLGFGAPNGVDGTVVAIFGIAAGGGTLIGGALGLVMGLVDGPIVVLLINRLFREVSFPARRWRIQTTNALLVTIGVLLTITLVMGIDVVISVEGWYSFAYYSGIALIAGAVFWYATGKFVDRTIPVNQTS